MKCPKDHTELATIVYKAAIQVARCPSCHGIWLDRGKLEQIRSAPGRDYSAEIARLPDVVDKAYSMALEKTAPPLDCPNCGKSMERREHGYCSQILIDVCPSCHGIWLDDAELGALENFFERAKYETDEIRRGYFSALRHLF